MPGTRVSRRCGNCWARKLKCERDNPEDSCKECLSRGYQCHPPHPAAVQDFNEACRRLSGDAIVPLPIEASSLNPNAAADVQGHANEGSSKDSTDELWAHEHMSSFVRNPSPHCSWRGDAPIQNEYNSRMPQYNFSINDPDLSGVDVTRPVPYGEDDDVSANGVMMAATQFNRSKRFRSAVSPKQPSIERQKPQPERRTQRSVRQRVPQYKERVQTSELHTSGRSSTVSATLPDPVVPMPLSSTAQSSERLRTMATFHLSQVSAAASQTAGAVEPNRLTNAPVQPDRSHYDYATSQYGHSAPLQHPMIQQGAQQYDFFRNASSYHQPTATFPGQTAPSHNLNTPSSRRIYCPHLAAQPQTPSSVSVILCAACAQRYFISRTSMTGNYNSTL